MNDLIERQAAIDGLEDHYIERINLNDWQSGWNAAIDWMKDVYLDELPSVQPEPQPRSYEWIPCSETLPEDSTNCLVSVRCSGKVVVVDMATYSTDLFSVDEYDFYDNRGESGWYYYSGEYGYCKVLNVVAWMPLPEGYVAPDVSMEYYESGGI